MRTLYGSTSWRRVLALVLVFVMMVSTMGTSGYSVFADDLTETGEEVTVAEPEANVPEVTEDIQGPSPGEEESEAVVDPATDAEPVEASEDGEEPVADSELVETSEEVAEPVEATEDGEEPADAEPVEETEEGEEPADAETVGETEEAEPVEPAEETLISEAAKVIEGDDGEAVAEPVEATEEVVEEELPEEEILEEEVLMPAIDAEKLFEDARVTVSAPEGAFPDGTTVNIEEVTLGRTQSAAIENAVEAKVVSYKAYDITFNNGDQTDMQPAEGYAVKVNIEPYSMPAAENLQVVHMEDRRTAQVVESEATEEGLAFDAEHFSVYVVVEIGEDARLKVIFKNGSTEIASMYVKKDDNMEQVIYDPGAGTIPDGALFEGWTENADYAAGDAAMTMADIRAAITTKLTGTFNDGDEVIYYAKLIKQYNITYLDDNNTALNTDALKVRADAENAVLDYTVNQAFTADAGSNFEGWQVSLGGAYIDGYEAGKLYPNGTEIKVSGSVIFSVNAPAGHWIVFHENKGTYVAPQFVKSGENSVVPTIRMQKNGYTFAGWYTDSAFTEGTEYGFNQPLTNNIDLYAKWTSAEEANYTILIWKQNVNDAKDAADSAKTYDFAETISETGNVGSTIDTSAAEGKTYEGFHFNKSDANVTITPEGTAVANVYYDRNLVTLTFQYRNNGQWSTQATMTGLYGQTLAQNNYTWPTNRWWYDDYDYDWFNGYSGAGTRTTFLDAFILANGGDEQTYYGFAGNGTRTVHFMKQNASGEGYTEENTVNSTNGSFNISDKYNGYKAVSYSKNNRNWTDLGDKGSNGYYATVSDFTDLYIRYDALNYSILYFDGVYVDRDNNPLQGYESRGELHVKSGVRYGSNIGSYNKGGLNAYTPTYNGFVFVGWYIDELCTQEYTFTTMPEGITVYAKWVQIYSRVFLRPNAGTDSTLNWGSDDQSMNFLIANGGEASLPTGTRAEYEFVGWFMEDGTFFDPELFRIDSSITTTYDKTDSANYTDDMDKWGNGATYNKDVNRDWVTGKLELQGRWRAIVAGALGIGVIYDATSNGKDAPSDTTLYLDTAKAIAGAASKPKDETQKFEYWVVQTWNGTAYEDTSLKVFPGEDFEVLKSNAKIVVSEWVNPENKDDVLAVDNPQPGTTAPDNTHTKINKATYTVQLKAVYGPKDKPTPTHISWFKNDGNEAFQKDTIVEGENALDINAAVTIPKAPSRDGYTFLGWARVAISGEDPETAVSEAINWEKTSDNWTQNLTEDDLLVSYDVTTNSYTNVATGKAATAVAADEGLPYHAMFAVWKVNEYTVTYMVDGEQYGDVETYDYGAEVEPTREAPTKTGYTFSGWDKEAPETMPAENIVISGTFSINQYTVRFVNDDGTELQSEKLDYGVLPEYKGQTPTKAATAETSFSFNGWDKEIVKVTEDATYTATYERAAKQYTVTFVDEDGETVLLAEKAYDYGTPVDKIEKPADPTKAATATHTYTFAGWTPELSPVTANAVYKATYTEEAITYTIIYHSNYQSVVSTETEDDPIAVEGATTIVTFNDVLGPNNQKFSKTSPWSITRDGKTYTYTFAGWKDKNDNEYKELPYTVISSMIDQKDEGGSDQPATNEAGAVNTATSSLRSGLRMAFTTSFGGTLELWAQWTESTSGGGNNPRPRPNPDPTDEPEEPIDDPDTPLAPGTIDEPEEPIDDPDTPLAPYEEETEIDEEPTPLSPFTGDDRHTAVWGFVSLLSLAGIVLLGRKRREEE